MATVFYFSFYSRYFITIARMLTRKQQKSLKNKTKAQANKLRTAYARQNSRCDPAVSVSKKKNRSRVMGMAHVCHDPFTAHKVGFPSLLGSPPTVKFKQTSRLIFSPPTVVSGGFIVISRPSQFVEEATSSPAPIFQREAWGYSTGDPIAGQVDYDSFNYPRNPFSTAADLQGMQVRVVSKGMKIVYTGPPLSASGRFFVLNLRMPIRQPQTIAGYNLTVAAVQAHPETKVISAYEAMQGFELSHYVVDAAGVQNFYRLVEGPPEQATTNFASIWGSSVATLNSATAERSALRSWSTIYIVGSGLPTDSSFVVEAHEKLEAIYEADNFFSQLADSPHTGIMPVLKGINDTQSTVVSRSRHDIKAYGNSDDQVVGPSKKAIMDAPRSITSGGGPLRYRPH